MAGSRSLDLGSGRLADRYFASDPPGIEATGSVVAAAMERLQRETDLPASVDDIVFSGGNGVFLEAIAGQLFPDEPLERLVVARVLEHLAVTPASDTARRLGIVHERARVFPAGVGIALACLDLIPATQVQTAPSGIRRGLIREYLEHA
jgi:exopolyphosphatase/pppGpp-phosphohydrolase